MKNISLEEAKTIMDHIAQRTIDKVGIYDLDLTKCWESSYEIECFCQDKFNFCPLKIQGLGLKHLTHCLDIVSISPKYSFIIDLTYKQFDTNKYSLGSINGKRVYIKGPGKYISEKNKKELETVGYIPLTKENLIDYLYSFMKPYSEKFKVDEEFVLSETFGTIKDYGIKLCNIDDFEYSTSISVENKKKK